MSAEALAAQVPTQQLVVVPPSSPIAPLSQRSDLNQDLCDPLLHTLEVFRDLLEQHLINLADKQIEDKRITTYDVQGLTTLTKEIRATAKVIASMREPENETRHHIEQIVRFLVTTFMARFASDAVRDLREKFKPYIADEHALNSLVQSHLRSTGELLKEALARATEQMERILGTG